MSESEYDPWQRAFHGYFDPMILLRAIESEEDALKAHRKAHEYDADAEYKEYIAEQLAEYRD